MANDLYDTGKTWILDNTTDTPGNNGLRYLLMQSNYTFSAAHATVSAITAAGTEVDRSDAAILSLATTGDQTDTSVTHTIAAVNNGTISSIILYHDVDGTDANSVPIAYYDTFTPVVTNGSDIDIDDNATSGLLEIQ